MSSKREEERNEKIIRGLMKLPPNRRCINCNSLGPQYVCTNFWTFVCMTCSGIHREFTHRVKSVSMAKFTSQEVDALQKGGNQRARELFLKAWDSQRQRLPDNSNVDKVREFINNVYVQKKYALEKSSDRPPRDPQSLRSNEDETRRASSYHSYSQSPPYDFQYEERRYGKHGPALTRKPGSDRGLYEGKLSSFLSPSRFSDQTNDDRFANEGSNPRVSDYSISSGGDPFRSDILSPSSQRDTESSFGEISRNISSEITQHHAVLHNSDSNSRNAGERILHPQRTASSGSIGSFDSNSMSFKSVNSLGSLEIPFESEQSVDKSHEKASSFPYPPQSSVPGNFNDLDLFSAPFAPQNVTSGALPVSNSQLPNSSPAQVTDFFQQFPTSVPTVNEQKPSQTLQLSSLDLFTVLPQQQPAAPFNIKTSNVVVPNSEGWATFDIPQNLVPVGTGNSVPNALPPSDETLLGNVNPFSLVQSSSSQDSVSHGPSVSGPTFWHEGLQNVEGIPNNIHLWNAFEDSARQLQNPNVPKINEHAAGHHVSDVDKSLGFGAYKASNDDGNVRTTDDWEPSSSSLSSSHINMAMPDFSVTSAVAGGHPRATDIKPTNPFDLPYDSEMESGNVFWDMSSLQAALPNDQLPTSYVGDVNQSWFPQNSIPSFVPSGITLDSPSVVAGSLGFMAGKSPSNQISNIPAQGPVASIGGNPFA